MFSYLQKIGRSLMIPVAVLPAAAILMGIGYWIDPSGWGANSMIAALLIKSGGAIIEKMPILFAIGVAFGMSKDKHGSAALTGLVGFLVVTTLLSPAVVSMLTKAELDKVPAAFGKINNQFIGILVGVIGAELYNRFSHIKLPKALAFFSGKRLVPIIMSFVMIVLSFVLLFVWPTIFNALITFGKFVQGLGAAGAGIFGFSNRLLIPFGLHHALNSVFWFDVANINDIPNFLSGGTAEGAVAGVTGMYQAGFFPVMMFGLIGAAVAFIRTAKPENKAKVKSIMIAAAFASFFTGVTEPLEFAFMFVAPPLYALHAVFTGISMTIAAKMQWMSGFGFSAGFVDFVLSAKNPLAVKWFMLIVQGVFFFALYYFSFTFLIKKFNMKTPGREEAESEEIIVNASGAVAAASAIPNSHSELAAAILPNLGGKGNILSIDNCITRLRLDVKDTSMVNSANLKKITSGVLIPSKNAVQVIIGTEVEFVAEEFKKLVLSK